MLLVFLPIFFGDCGDLIPGGEGSEKNPINFKYFLEKTMTFLN